MLLMTAFIITIVCTLVAVLIVNGEVALKVLGNITFKWAFDKKHSNKESGTSQEKSSDYSIQPKGLEAIKINENTLGKWIGYRLLLLSSILMLFVGIMYTFSNPQPVTEFEGQIYVDDEKMGLFLINIEALSIAIFIIIATLKSMGIWDKILGTNDKVKKDDINGEDKC